MSSNAPIFSADERRRAHRAGATVGLYTRKTISDLESSISPDEGGKIGIGIRADTTANTLGNILCAQYLGRATGGKFLDFISVVTTVNGTGTPGTLCGFATSASGPDFTDKSLFLVNGTQLDTTTAGIGKHTNAVPLRFLPQTGTHIWCWYCPTNGTTNASVRVWTGEIGVGVLQRKIGTPSSTIVIGTTVDFVRPAPAITGGQCAMMYVS